MKLVDAAACNNAFGNFIREKRQSKGLSQMELASSIGLTQSHFSRLESGERSADLAMMINLFRELNVNPMEFLSRYM